MTSFSSVAAALIVAGKFNEEEQKKLVEWQAVIDRDGLGTCSGSCALDSYINVKVCAGVVHYMCGPSYAKGISEGKTDIRLDMMIYAKRDTVIICDAFTFKLPLIEESKNKGLRVLAVLRKDQLTKEQIKAAIGVAFAVKVPKFPAIGHGLIAVDRVN